MKTFKEKITLIRNNRGCYIIDTIKGCNICKDKPNGCYDNCYAKNISDRYKFDFESPIKRDFYYDINQLYLFDFYDTNHIDSILKQIHKIEMPFIRIGEMGDPSENWEHTINICKILSIVKIPIVIITKHWKSIPENLLKEISNLNIIINTSISALDNDYEIEYRLSQYELLKKYCKSILRIVSCDFNKDNHEGFIRSEIQEMLFDNENIINTIFRPNKNNSLVVNNIINISNVKFMNSNIIASVYKENSYLGFCDKCPDMCGFNLKD